MSIVRCRVCQAQPRVANEPVCAECARHLPDEVLAELRPAWTNRRDNKLAWLDALAWAMRVHTGYTNGVGDGE